MVTAGPSATDNATTAGSLIPEFPMLAIPLLIIMVAAGLLVYVKEKEELTFVIEERQV